MERGCAGSGVWRYRMEALWSAVMDRMSGYGLMAKLPDMLMMRLGETGGTKGQEERKGGCQVGHGWVVGGVAKTTRASLGY